jgi:hypothetical protein
MTDEEILDAAAEIIAKRARALQLLAIRVDVYPNGSFAVRKFGSAHRETSMYASTSARATLGKAWAKEETR